MAVKPGQVATYWRHRNKGESIAQSAARAGFSESTAHRLEERRKTKPEWSPAKEAQGRSNNSIQRAVLLDEADLPGPIPYDLLCPEAKRALEDFVYFRRRYFGRLSPPWANEAALLLVALLHSDEREFVDMNLVPGIGKSTILADFKCWLICRDRRVRIMTGSATQHLARRSLMRVRRSLERTKPLKADPSLLARGLAVDAESTLVADFGRFKPTNREAWSQDALIVMQHDDIAIEEKEATLTAYGIDTEFTGGRFDFVEWDDLVSPDRINSPGYREELERIYTQTCETRVEPEGLLMLCGQRLASDDLHRFVLDQVRPREDEDEDDDEAMTTLELKSLSDALEGDREFMKYQHIVYKAHYVDRCLGTRECHKKDAPAYPEGCLVDPYRIPWRDIRTAEANSPAEFALVWQQEDADPDKALARREWIYGDDQHVGCLDYERALWEIPESVSYNDCLVYATADPSPSMYWSVQCWVYHRPSERRILIGHERKKMRANEFLDRSEGGGFEGIMEEWQNMSVTIGFPITYWIVEANAAQKFILQYNHVKDWRIARGVEIIPHTTGVNKADSNYGVWTMQGLYRLGRVRLPMKHGESAVASLKLIEEAIVYDHGRTDDCIMAQWMGEWNLPNLIPPNTDDYVPDRPTWVKNMAF